MTTLAEFDRRLRTSSATLDANSPGRRAIACWVAAGVCFVGRAFADPQASAFAQRIFPILVATFALVIVALFVVVRLRNRPLTRRDPFGVTTPTQLLWWWIGLAALWLPLSAVVFVVEREIGPLFQTAYMGFWFAGAVFAAIPVNRLATDAPAPRLHRIGSIVALVLALLSSMLAVTAVVQRQRYLATPTCESVVRAAVSGTPEDARVRAIRDLANGCRPTAP